MTETWAVIPTRNRPELLRALIESLEPSRTVVVDNGDNPWITELGARRIKIDRDPANISRWWNIGLDAVAEMAGDVYDVAVLNDDLRLPAGTLDVLSQAIRTNDAAASFPDMHNGLALGQQDVLRVGAPHNLFHRMSGFCFMLRGEQGLRADEELVWWYGDDDLEWRAAQSGGVVRVGGLAVEHLMPNHSTATDPALSAQTALDRATFVAKWGHPPW